MFSLSCDEYNRRYGLRRKHLARIAEINFGNARRNPNAQTRKWSLTTDSFSADDQANPVIDGCIREQYCGQITDGAAIVFLASRTRLGRYASEHGISIDSQPRISGWGHRTAHISYDAKIQASRNEPHIFPHVRGRITDAFKCAGVTSIARE